MTDLCPTCQQEMPDPHTGPQVAAMREAAGATESELAAMLTVQYPHLTARKVRAIETGKADYPRGFYADAKDALKTILASRAATLGMSVEENGDE